MGFYFRNALGFFIQLYPCALMIFLPFSQEACRFRRKWIITGTTLVSTAMALVFPLVLYPARYNNPLSGVVGNIFMLCAILLILAVYIWLVRDSLIKKVLAFSIVMFYAAAQYMVVNTVSHFLRHLLGVSYIPLYDVSGFLLYATTALLMLPLMLGAVIRPFGEFIREIDPRMMRREFSVTVFVTFFSLTLMVYCSMLYYAVLGAAHIHLRWLIPLYFFLICNQAIIYWLVFRESVRRKRDEDKRRTMENRQMQYEKITGEIEDVRRMRHDLRHHYNSLYDLLEKGRLDEIREYLSRVIDTTVKRENEVYCRNMTINGLLQYYVGQARDEGIRCEVHADCGDLPVEPEDLTVLFGNAMENAIHACRKYPENRWISVFAGTISGSLAIEISNSCKAVRFNRRFQTEDGFSPAEAFQSDRESGGYGLRSLAYIAQKYDGSARFRFNAETETFTTRIRLNVNI